MHQMKKYYGSWAILAGLWITACTEPNQPKEMVPSVKLEQVKDNLTQQYLPHKSACRFYPLSLCIAQ